MDTSFGTGAYPHNMLIETGMALGILGLSVMIILFMRAALRVWHFYNVQHPLIAMILIQQVVAMQLSGALWATDAFFMVLGMVLTATTSVKQFAPTPNTFHRRI